MLFNFINDKTGFANGDLFESESEVREYFTVENMHDMFGTDYKISQEELNQMARIVIREEWHIEKPNSRVFSIRVNSADSLDEVNKKIDDLAKKAREFIS